MAVEYTESIESILKDLIPDLPGVVRSVAARECRLAMREFFEKSLAWTDEVENVAIPSGNTAIQIDDGDANTTVAAILRVMIGNSTDGFQELTPLARMPDKVESTDNRPWGWYINSSPDEILLHPYPASAPTDVLRVTVGLMPALDVDINTQTLPRQITLRYYEAILNGTKARLMMQSAKPYSQPMMAQQLRHNFLRAIGYYAAQRKKGYNNTPMWSYPRGWTTRLRQRFG